MTLQNLLTSIKNRDSIAASLVAATTGPRFEENISTNLKKEGTYTNLSVSEYRATTHYSDLKRIITSADTKNQIINVPNLNRDLGLPSRIIINQPHGKNNYPDFLLIYNDFVLPLEIKFSKSTGKKPTWNGGYPRSKSIYIFGSYGMRQTSSFVGDDYLEPAERLALLSVSDIATNAMADAATSNPDYDEAKFSVYMRAMYNQKFNTIGNENEETHQINAISLAASCGF